jgi:hypothetical protein
MIELTVIYLVFMIIVWVALYLSKFHSHPSHPTFVVNIQKQQNLTVYSYNLPGRALPAALYRQGSDCLEFTPESEHSPAMMVCGTPVLAIRGKDNLKLLGEAISHIGQHVDKKA